VFRLCFLALSVCLEIQTSETLIAKGDEVLSDLRSSSMRNNNTFHAFLFLAASPNLNLSDVSDTLAFAAKNTNVSVTLGTFLARIHIATAMEFRLIRMFLFSNNATESVVRNLAVTRNVGLTVSFEKAKEVSFTFLSQVRTRNSSRTRTALIVVTNHLVLRKRIQYKRGRRKRKLVYKKVQKSEERKHFRRWRRIRKQNRIESLNSNQSV
jgi:hypothetical protein